MEGMYKCKMEKQEIGELEVELMTGAQAYEAGGGGGGGGEGSSPTRIVQIAIFGQKSYNIRAKPLDFRASNV